ncbi:unnamed protein product [Prorocentrum cordatum]|uniref:Uncharacterized protein n=1 Tax=Prorocentrum cordatum TaxID=2364126 RepID=A0ABN9VZ47_9DINO|nr:unnamed protein product [Polarella glacialis]
MGGVFGHACAGADDDGEDAESTRCGAPCLCCHGGPEEHEDEPDTDEECSSPEQGLRGCGAAPAGVVWAPVPGTPPTFGVVPAVQVARQDSLASLSSSATAFPNAAHLSRVADLAQCPPPPPLGTGPLRGGGCSCSSSATVRTLPPCWEQPEAAGAPAPAAAAVTPLPRRYGTASRRRLGPGCRRGRGASRRRPRRGAWWGSRAGAGAPSPAWR